MDLFALATVPTGPDEAGEPPPTNFYTLRDNLRAWAFLANVFAREPELFAHWRVVRANDRTVGAV